MSIKLSPMVRSYLETALWSTIAMIAEDDCDSTYDAMGYTIDDFHPDAIAYAAADCEGFGDECDMYLQAEHGLQSDIEGNAGHDFWLTRERHGAGFWDGDWKYGDELTKVAHAYGSCDMYVDAEGLIHFQGDTARKEWNDTHPEQE